MKNIAPIILSSILLLPGSSIASDRSNHQINSASSPQISQTPPIDSELETIRQADAEAAQKVKQIATAITVRVTSATNGGSGVLIAKKGNTYLVLTNAHVTRRGSQFEIQAPGGQKYTAKPIDGGFDAKYDLALLEFTSQKDYQLADLAHPGILKPNDRSIYSAGFPFDSKEIRIAPGEVTQLSDIPFDNGTQIGYEIAKGEKGVRQGMSGGPIFDVTGILLGINTIGAAPILPNYTYKDGSKPLAKLAAKYREANWGVPVYNFLTNVKADILYGYDNLPKVERQVTPIGYLAKLNNKARQMTVRIENSGGSGSGVIVAKEGNSYYVLTAKHNLQDEKYNTHQKFTNHQIITYDQDRHPVISTVVAEGVDLAVVKFSSSSNYPLARLGEYSPNQNVLAFVGGFPGRAKINSPLWQWQLNPGVVNDPEQGKLQTQTNKSFSNGYDLIYSSISYEGMSGGPVFDTEGNVIGIHGRAESTDLKSLGISIQTFTGLAAKLQISSSLLNIVKNQPVELNLGDLDNVIAAMQNIPEPQAGDDGNRWLAYGNQLSRTGQYGKSVKAFDMAIAKGKGLTGNYGKALSLFADEKSDLGEIAIAKAIALVPSNNRTSYYYLWKYQSMGFRALQKHDEALKAINTAIELEPNDLISYNEKANILTKQKKYTAAIDILTNLIRIKPEAYTFLNRGNAQSGRGNKQAAIDDYDRAIILNPKFSMAYYNRGGVKSYLGNKQAAIVDFDMAIFLNSKFADAYNNRGGVKSSLGNKQAAIADFERAISLNPKMDEAYNNLGLDKSALGKNQEAIADYDRAIAINPKNTEAYYNRGVAKSRLGKNQEAIADYSLAIVLNSKYVEAYGNRCAMKSDLGYKQDVIIDCDRAIALNSKYANAYYNRGVFKYKSGDKQGAITDMIEAAELFRQQGQMNDYKDAMGLLKKFQDN
jgi:tetratricopeptide (TPR) repeat protein/S1-C subfamily serine protease